MKLVKIKEFNSENITQEIAADLCAIVGLQKFWKRDKVIERGFTIIDKWYGKFVDGRGGSYMEKWNDPNYTQPGYIRTHRGVTITINYELSDEPRTYHLLSINADGRATMIIFHQKGAFKSMYTGDSRNGIPLSTEYYDQSTNITEYPCNQVELVQYYLDKGFYTVGNDLKDINHEVDNNATMSIPS